MEESVSFIKRWLATLITIPLSVIFFVIGLLSTGGGHGTSMILKLFYAPLYLLQRLAVPGGIVVGVLLCCGQLVGYAAIADKVKYHPKGVMIFVGLLLLHYSLFSFYAQDPKDQELFAKSFLLDPGFLVFAVVLFVLWQVALLAMIILQRRNDSNG